MPPGFLAVLTHPSSSLSLADFHAWYEDEHIPLRLNHLPAFLSGARYQAVDLDLDHSQSSTDDASAPTPLESQDTEEPLPTWLALYEIDDTRTFSAPSYTSLRERRSPREADVMRRIDVLVRWTGEEVGVWYADLNSSLGGGEADGLGEREDGDGEKRTTGLKPGRPSRCVVTHTLSPSPLIPSSPPPGSSPDDTVKRWAEQVIRQATSTSTSSLLEDTSTHQGKEPVKDEPVKEESVKALVSTRIVRVLEGGKTRLGVPVPENGGKKEEKGKERVEYLVVHELDSLPSASDTDAQALRNIISSLSPISFISDHQSPGSGPGNKEEEDGKEDEEGKWKVKVDQWRVWKLHKAYPCIAQGNVDVHNEVGS